MRVDAVAVRGALLARPRGISPRTAAHALAAVFAVIGVLVVLATLPHAGRPGHVGPLVAVLALALSLVTVNGWRGLAPWSSWAAHTAMCAAVAAGVWSAQSGSDAVAWGFLFVPLLLQSFLVLSWAEAGLEFLLATGLLLVATTVHPEVDLANQVVVVGVLLSACLVTGWLVRVSAAAEVDVLTGLPNRRGVQRWVRETVAGHGELRDPEALSTVVLALLDLDHFKGVNDSLGHAAGDDLLRLTAGAARSVLPPGAVFGRWGGDEFVLITTGRGTAVVEDVLDRLRAQLPEGRTVSAGLALRLPDEDLSDLVRRADEALYAVKRTERGISHVHGSSAGGWCGPDAVVAAVARGELEVHYQPIVELATGEVCGAEALVRWRHPVRGLLAPAEFIPRCEADGSIAAVGRMVLTTAAHEAATWPRRGDGIPRTVSVNVSGYELALPGFVEGVERVLAASGLERRALLLEITEGAIDATSEVVPATLAGLRDAGMRLALDDFGAGWSSLARIASLPLEVLKIDRSLTSLVTRLDDDGALLGGVVALAAAIGLDAVAEGVETADQAVWLRERGCRWAQGYFYGRPLRVEQFRRRLTDPVRPGAPFPAAPSSAAPSSAAPSAAAPSSAAPSAAAPSSAAPSAAGSSPVAPSRAG